MRTEILFEDNDLCVVHKPAGLATQTGSVGQKDVVSELKGYLSKAQKKPSPYLGVVHRLDQPVEGVLVFAKTQKAAAALTKQLGDGFLNKEYYAVVYGVVDKKGEQLTDYLLKEGNISRVVTKEDAAFSQAKKAVLVYETVKVNSERNCSKVRVTIQTGRFHQIRVQMAHAGMPLLGDSKYGTEEAMEVSKALGVRNVALCAYSIRFIHPVTGKKMEFCIDSKEFIFNE